MLEHLEQADLCRRTRQLDPTVPARVGGDKSRSRQLGDHALSQGRRNQHFSPNRPSGETRTVLAFGQAQKETDRVVALAGYSEHVPPAFKR